jgi:PLP dependent protein
VDLTDRLFAVRERVARACDVAGRDRQEVTIMLATKTQPADLLRQTFALPAAAGMLRGENRVQELAAKGSDLAGLGVETHLIGPLQSNKVNAALRWVTCVQSVASVDLAQRVADRVHDRVLDVMVQVNVSGEPTKHGVAPDQALDLAAQVALLDGLRVTGFMTIGANTSDLAEVRAGYARLRSLRDDAVASGLTDATHLSMGMSNDLEAAVAEGATIVRVGTAVFGARS